MNLNETMKLRDLFTLTLIVCCSSIQAQSIAFNIEIPTGGNTWVVDQIDQTSEVITENGITNWTDPTQVLRTYFYADTIGKVSVGLSGSSLAHSIINVSFGSSLKKVEVPGPKFKKVYVGDYEIKTPGYQYIDIKGIFTTGDEFAEIKSILIGSSDPESIKYLKDDFYFGRRGPSTHWSFEVPEAVDKAEWFYNEIMIPKDQDIIGSYYMANGFGEGYFGIQVNSTTERRVLFSIWSPYKTDNPNEIPNEYKIQLLKKGKDVVTKKFGNEGSGGQSYKVHNWKPEVTYKFLTQVKPAGNDYTDYTSFFFDPAIGTWGLIAKFRRPKTDTYLTRPYSFLENFIPNQGIVNRKGYFKNQWICDSNGKWHELTKAKFTADATARKDARLDYSGGVDDKGFYLKNFGFSNERTPIDSEFTRQPNGIAPSIDFGTLENLISQEED